MNVPELGSPERWLYGALAVLVACLWLAGLGARPLFNPDEGRYAEIPREMLAGGDWIIPHLNGLAYAEKPPLQYWATALCYELFGINEFAARLYTALCALGTVISLWFIARVHGAESAAWRAAALLAGMLLFSALGHLLTLDMGLTFYLTMSMMGFLHAQRPETRGSSAEGRWMLLAWACAALGVMSKGIVAAAIPAAVLALYSLWTRDFSAWRRLHWPAGLTLFFLLTVPWHWLAARRDNDFLTFYFVHEHVARYLTPIAQRVEPWWFFIAVLVTGSAPWTLSALRVVVVGWRRSLGAGFDAKAFLWAWVIFVLVFFSLSDSKLIPYVLPIMPAMALSIALSPIATLRRDCLAAAVLSLVVGAALCVASLRWPQLLLGNPRAAYFLPLSRAVIEIGALLAVSGAFVLLQSGRLHPARFATRACVFLGVGWCLASIALNASAGAVAPIYSDKALAASIPVPERLAPIYSVATYDQGFEFYLRRTVTLVHFRGELDYGLNKNPGAAIADLDEFVEAWAAAPQAFALMEISTFEQLKGQGLPMRIIGRGADRVVAARR